MQFFENYRMAQIVQATAGDRYTLHLELDDVMADFPAAMTKIMRFLEIKQQQGGGGGEEAAAAAAAGGGGEERQRSASPLRPRRRLRPRYLPPPPPPRPPRGLQW